MFKRLLKFLFGRTKKEHTQQNDVPSSDLKIPMPEIKSQDIVARSAFTEVFKEEMKDWEANKKPGYRDIEWQTILVCDPDGDMGRIVTLRKKGRDQSEEWDSLMEQHTKRLMEKEQLYKEGKLYRPNREAERKKYQRRFVKAVFKDRVKNV